MHWTTADNDFPSIRPQTARKTDPVKTKGRPFANSLKVRISHMKSVSENPYC